MIWPHMLAIAKYFHARLSQTKNHKKTKRKTDIDKHINIDKTLTILDPWAGLACTQDGPNNTLLSS